MSSAPAIGPNRGTGNRCGHDPENPRYFQPHPDARPRPGIIEKLVRAAEVFYRRPSTLPGLGFHPGKAPGAKHRLVRSEAREAEAAVLGSCLYRMDIVTRHVMSLDAAGNRRHVSIDELRASTGIDSPERAERAFATIARVGVCGSSRRAELNAQQEIRGRPSAKQIPIAVIRALGCYREWEAASREEYQRRKSGGETADERARRLRTLHPDPRTAAEMAEGRRELMQIAATRGPKPIASLLKGGTLPKGQSP